ncbi:probable glutamate receptor [Cryptotermes secundus]|uniref:probable glutamate receptor n=1 Tax=Cryptotermes secundus TaxID=105785 RepID=UPI001454DF28|nr:probable glutamate receptor [Cryptotermes secundus]
MVVAEVYRISPKLPLQTRRLGDLHYQNLYERRNNLHGLAFRSAVIESTNLLYITEMQHNTILKIGGFFGEVWNALQMRLNFSSQFVKAPQNSWGVELPNHTWDGVMGSMVRGEANFSSIGLAATRARRRAIDFLTPLVELRTAVYIRKPGISTNWNNFLDPFSSLLWGTILLTILILSACLSAAWRLVTRTSNLPLWYIVSESVFRIFGNFCNQGHDMNMNSSACRMIIMTSYVTTTVLLAAYSAALVSFMTVQDFKLPFSSFQELLQLRHYRLGTLAGSAQISYFEQSQDALMREMYRRKIQPEVDRLPRGVYEGLTTLCTRHRYAYFASVPDAEMMKASLPCAVVHVPGTAIRSYLSFAISKRSPYKGVLEHYSMRLASNGVIKRLYRQQYSARPFGNDASSQQIDIQAASPLLAVLGAGMLLSVLLLAGELTVSRLSVTAHTGRYSETVPSPKGRHIQKGYERRPLKKGKGLKFCNQRQDEAMETSAFRTCHRCLQPQQRKLLQHTEMTSRTTLLYDRGGEYTEQMKL